MKQEIEHYENRSGGVGTIHIERLLSTTEMSDHINMYAKVTIDTHSSIGFHIHEGDNESYYVLSGEARYQDNEIERILHVGDVTYTQSGKGHAIENIGTQPLIIMALIIKN